MLNLSYIRKLKTRILSHKRIITFEFVKNWIQSRIRAEKYDRKWNLQVFTGQTKFIEACVYKLTHLVNFKHILFTNLMSCLLLCYLVCKIFFVDSLHDLLEGSLEPGFQSENCKFRWRCVFAYLSSEKVAKDIVFDYLSRSYFIGRCVRREVGLVF